MARIDVLNPFGAPATVTTSSLQGHHVPYGGTMSCDMDVDTASRGTPVLLRVRTNGPALRGRVESVRPACASRDIEHGGFVVVVALERAGGEPTGLRIAYAHLDPVRVAEADVIEVDETVLGALGPEVAQNWGPERGLSGHVHAPEDPRRAEYHSRCAQHSHLHVEGFGAESVIRARNRPGVDDPVMSFTAGGDVAVPEVVTATPSISRETAEAGLVAAPIGTYTVQPGESLLDVAAKLGVPLAALVAANAGLIEAGDRLTVPGQVYVVRPRDTLGEIARRFGVSLADLVAINGIENADVIAVDQVLTIPR
jgi:LysM repeat protein